MISIEVTGFQSIEDTRVRVDGFTALVGRSNIGKSALVRAVKCALTNSPGTSFVRHGGSCARLLRDAKTCRCIATVHIVTDNFDLLWEKGDTVNRYVFNGKQYDKPGHGIPDFLIASGFAPVKVGDDYSCVQVADQFFPIFLLNQSGPSIAEAISDVARLDRINRAVKLVEKDRREAVATRKVREKDAQELRGRLAGFDGLENASDRVAGVEGLILNVESSEGKVAALGRYAELVSSLTKRVRKLTKVESVPIPEIDPVKESNTNFRAISGFLEELGDRLDNYKGVEWVEGFIGKIPETKPSVEAHNSVRLLEGWIAKLRSVKDSFTSLGRVSGVEAPYCDGASDLLKVGGDLERYLKRESHLRSSIAKLESSLGVVSKEEEQVLAEAQALGVCPTCSQPFRVDHTGCLEVQ